MMDHRTVCQCESAKGDLPLQYYPTECPSVQKQQKIPQCLKIGYKTLLFHVFKPTEFWL